MELRTLRYLVAVVDQASFSRAARQLHITQPALSRSVSSLEAELGTRLLERSRDGVRVTSAGAVIYERALVMLNEWKCAKADVVAVGGGPLGEVTIGATPSVRDGLLLEAILSLRKKQPQVRLRVESGMTGGSLTDRLRRGDLELVVGPVQAAASKQDLMHETLFRDVVAPIAHRSHPAIGRRSTNKSGLAELVNENWVLFGSNVLSRQHLSGAFIAAGLPPPSPTVECDAPELALSLVLQGAMVGYLPRRYYLHLLAKRLVLEIGSAALVWRQDVGLSYRARGTLSPGAQLVIQELRRAAAGHGEGYALAAKRQ